MIGIAGQYGPGAEQYPAQGTGEPGPLLVQDGPAERAEQADEADAQDKGHLGLGLGPSMARNERLLEHGPCIDGSQTELHDNCSDRDNPSFAFKIFVGHTTTPSMCFLYTGYGQSTTLSEPHLSYPNIVWISNSFRGPFRIMYVPWRMNHYSIDRSR